jgi:NADH:ubiquinone oxidoreductase subunit C
VTPLEAILSEAGASGAWEERRGSWWFEPEALDVRRMAVAMRDRQARFITITALAEEGQPDLKLTYHWDLDGQLLSVSTRVKENRTPSIYGICEAADWIEREIHEQYTLEFEDRPYEPLLLRAGDAAGVNLRAEDE